MLNIANIEKNMQAKSYGIPPKIHDIPAKINVWELTKKYQTKNGEFLALQQVSLHVKEQEFVSIVGPSGCGKSTLLRILAGLEEATGGKVEIAGKEIDGPGADRGMVFQSYTLFPWLTVRENIEFGPRLKGMPAWQRKGISDHYLAMIGLEQFAHAYPKELSGGMKQRVAIARALANQPEVLLMDEPFGALDAQTKSAMQELLLQIWEKERTTVVFITHDIDEAIYLSQRIYVMNARPGRIAAEFPVEFAYPRDRDIRDTEAFIKMKKRIVSLLHH